MNYFDIFQVREREHALKKLQARVGEVEDEIRQNQFLIHQSEKELANLKRLKEDKKLELNQVNDFRTADITHPYPL